MKLPLFLAALFSVVASASAGPVELDLDNFESKLSGKNAFVKFFAPWCGHCKSMKPAWDKLGDEFASSSSVLIGDADCTGDAKDLCDKFQVKGFPTIKYWDSATELWEGEQYSGGRDYDSLKKFLEETLEVKCDVSSPDGCSDKEKAYINKMKEKSAEERKSQLERLETMKDGKMKPELKQWLIQRIRILQALAKNDGDEL